MHLTFIPFIALFSVFDSAPWTYRILVPKQSDTKVMRVDIFTLKSYIRFGDRTVFSEGRRRGGLALGSGEWHGRVCAPQDRDTAVTGRSRWQSRREAWHTSDTCFITSFSRNRKKSTFPSFVSIYSLFPQEKINIVAASFLTLQFEYFELDRLACLWIYDKIVSWISALT